MLRKLNVLVPAFLKRLDQQLLLHAPQLWATRIHFVAFYGGLLTLLLLGGMNQYEVRLDSIPNPDVVAWLVSIPLLLTFCFWVYRMSFFQANKGYGKRGNGSSLRDQALYALVIAVGLGLPFLIGQQVGNRIADLRTEEQLAEDICHLNAAIPILNESLDNGRYADAIYDFDANIYFTDYESCTYQGSAMDIGTKTLALEAFIEVYERYSGKQMRFSARDLEKASREKNVYLSQQDVYQDFSSIRSRLKLIASAHADRFGVQSSANQPEGLLLIIFAGTCLFLLMQLFLLNGGKQLAFAALIGVGGAASLGIFAAMMQGMGVYAEEPYFAMVLMGIGFFIYQGYRRKNTQRTAYWKGMSLSLGVFFTPFVPLFFAASTGFNMNPSRLSTTLLLGCALAIVLWNLAYRPRFEELHAQPRDN